MLYFVWLFSFSTNQEIMMSSRQNRTFLRTLGFEAKAKDIQLCPQGQGRPQELLFS